jgi:MarR family transcriptional regulator, lower aerobic nicotinate degradation pathway regulator
MASKDLIADKRKAGAGFLLAKLGKVCIRRFTAALMPSGLKPNHAHALMQLRDNRPMTQHALGEALEMDPSNLVALLNDLESEGLAVRRRDPEDRRRHIVDISESGAARLAEAERTLATAEEQLLTGLDEEEREQLQKLVARVLENTAAVEAPCAEDEVGEDAGATS